MDEAALVGIRASYMSAVGGGRCVSSASAALDPICRRLATVALEHLPVGLAEVLRKKSIDDGVHRGVAVC